MKPRTADWIGLEEAIAQVVAAMEPTAMEHVSLRDALARVVAQQISSPVDLPPWDNSAMDGFALRAADIETASEDAPLKLRLIESVPAGSFATRAVASGECIKIMTGAPVPEGADSVVRVEHTEQHGDDVLVFANTDALRNIRPRGEDVKRNTTVIAAGTLLRPGQIGLLASVGCASVPVHRKPVVAILSTGDELVDVEQFDDVVAGRAIINSNSYAIAAAVRSVGAQPLELGIARDNEADLRAHLERARQADVLVTTAGASVGEHDLVKDVLEHMGAKLSFWRVRIRPGSPFSFGTWHGKSVFGLPGNPVSALVTFEIMVKPALRRMLGRSDLYTPVVTATLAESVKAGVGLTQFLRVGLSEERGTFVARLTGPQGSGILSSVAQAHGLMVVPEDALELAAGSEVKVVRLMTSDDAQAQPGYQTRIEQ